MEIVRGEPDSNFLKILSIRDYAGNDIEQKALELYQCLHSISKSDEKYVYLYLRITHFRNNSKSDKLPRNFKIILLSSLRHLKLTQIFPMGSWIHIIVKDLMHTLDYLDFRSLYLFKVLDQVVLKKLELMSDVQQLLLNKLYEVCYTSPLATLKNFAVSLIYKMELKIGNGLKTFDPLKNIGLLTNNDETKIKLEQIKTETLLRNMRGYMEFIHKYFHFNVYNKAAGILYKTVISRFDINDFKTHIWPFWCKSFEKQGDSREFHQSFLKYWIPFSVQEYKTDLYIFLRSQNVSDRLLVEILFELRRRKCVPIKHLMEGVYHEDFICFMDNFEVNEKALEILCTFPSLNEVIPLKCLENFKEHFLGGRIQTGSLEKYGRQFMTHIFVSEHVNIQKKVTERIYDDFMRQLRDFVVDSLEQEKNLDLCMKLCKILIGMKDKCGDLKIKYEVPKKYQYGSDENKYLAYLQESGILDIFTKKKDMITDKLVKIFNENFLLSTDTTYLLKNAFNTFKIEDLHPKIARGENYVSLQNLQKFADCQTLKLSKASKETERSVLAMIENEFLLSKGNINLCDECLEEIFDTLKILNALVLANQMGIVEEYEPSFVVNMMKFIVGVLEKNKHEGLSTRTRKVSEHLFCKILEFLRFSPTAIRQFSEIILGQLVTIIERSNMKKVVTDALNLVPQISGEMTTRSLIKFYQELLDSIVSPVNLNHLEKNRMRKHPRLRSLLHAVCKGAGTKQREFVVKAVRKIIWKVTQHDLDPTVHTVLLECLEILLVEPNFHSYTSDYLEETVKLSLNSFQSNGWTVKNAAIQLTNTVISRIFGVQQTDNIRLRSFQEFCVLFPELSNYFYDILSANVLEDRAIIVLQYLSASEVLTFEYVNREARETVRKFLILLQRLLVSSENYIIKFVPKAIVNLCEESTYPQYMRDILNFIIRNLYKKPSNVIVNHLVLFKEFVKKINENVSFLKPMDIIIDKSIKEVVNEMNNFSKNKDLKYLDLYNIRHFVLEQNESCDNLKVENLNCWNLYNTITNFSFNYVSKNFEELFEIINGKEEFHYLLEIFLDQTIRIAVDENDLELIEKVFRKVTTNIFGLNTMKDKKLCRIFTESILSHKDAFKDLSLDDYILDNKKELNFYESVVIQIVLSNKNFENRSYLCRESFKKLSQFSGIDNFEFELLPKTLIFLHTNLDILDKYSFLQFLLVSVLSECDKEEICEFLTNFCKKSVNEDDCLQSLLDLEFLYNFLDDANVVQKYLEYALKLIEKSENKSKFPTFYNDTYHSLKMYKDVINKMLLTFYENSFF